MESGHVWSKGSSQRETRRHQMHGLSFKVDEKVIAVLPLVSHANSLGNIMWKRIYSSICESNCYHKTKQKK